MRIVPPLALVVILLLTACAATTQSPAATTNEYSTGDSAAVQSPAPAADPYGDSAAASPESSPAAGADPVDRNNMYSEPPAMQIDPSKSYTATIETTAGTMTAELFASDAPKTVNNFVFLARDDFYDGIKFHRIIKDFMVQTGDPLGEGRGGPGYRFEDEPVTRDYVRGTLAMANSGPNTNGSQFFIVHQDYPLPPNYTIFGQVTDGLDVLDAIADTPVAMGGESVPSLPTEDVRIVNIEISEQ
jgi:cyclophilin family peptidyl-prolyl cis-trans isomerase